MRVLAIDPGVSGALALYDDELDAMTIHDMPIAMTSGRSQILEAQLVKLIRTWRPDAAVLELVHSLPKQGVASTFSFGVGFGVLKGVLAGLGIPYSFLTPQEWRRIAQVPGRGGDKGSSRIRASQLFPTQCELFARAKDHGRADAALIAYAYIRKSLTNS